MRKMPSMIITMYTKARRMTSIQSVVKTKEKSVNMRLREFHAEPFLYK